MKTQNNKLKILMMLKEAGSKGIVFARLAYNIHIIDYRKYISMLRQEGHDICSKLVAHKNYKEYWMV